jgi:hypothetical protein
MTYGDGATSFTGPLTALDDCGHEITHAVTTNSAKLTYSYESGALNESFSDIFGEAIENYGRPTQWSWKIGEDITPGNAGIRDMSNPNVKNHAKYYKGSKWYTGTLDDGGVHWNSGVQNYWYYLITMGAKGTNEIGNVFSVDSLGFVKSGKVASLIKTMKGVLIGSDFLKLSDGIKFLEINTDVDITDTMISKLELDNLFNYLTTNAYTKLVLIYKTNSLAIYCQQRSGRVFI